MRMYSEYEVGHMVQVSNLQLLDLFGYYSTGILFSISVGFWAFIIKFKPTRPCLVDSMFNFCV